jgi:hypothetical protein
MVVVIVMKCWGVAGPFETTSVGQYLETVDFEAYHGRGFVRWTADPEKAMRFPSAGAAMQFWKTQSKTVPIRPDGKPNRPLTAYHVEIVTTER